MGWPNAKALGNLLGPLDVPHNIKVLGSGTCPFPLVKLP